MQPDIVIETRNLTKVYRDFWGRQKVRALKALDLEDVRHVLPSVAVILRLTGTPQRKARHQRHQHCEASVTGSHADAELLRSMQSLPGSPPGRLLLVYRSMRRP